MVEFDKKSTPKTREGKSKEKKKRNTFDTVNGLYEGRELTLNAFKSGIFQVKEAQGKLLKILTPKQML